MKFLYDTAAYDADRAQLLSESYVSLSERSSCQASFAPHESFARRSVRKVFKVGMFVGVTAALSSVPVAVDHYSELHKTDAKVAEAIDRSGMDEVDELLEDVDWRSPIEATQALIEFVRNPKYEGSLTRFKAGIENVTAETTTEAQALGSSSLNAIKGAGLTALSGIGLWLTNRKRRKSSTPLSTLYTLGAIEHTERLNPLRRFHVSRTNPEDSSELMEIKDRISAKTFPGFAYKYLKGFTFVSLASFGLTAAAYNSTVENIAEKADGTIAALTPDSTAKDPFGIGAHFRDRIQEDILDDVSKTAVEALPNTVRILGLSEDDLHSIIDDAIERGRRQQIEEKHNLNNFEFFTTTNDALYELANKDAWVHNWHDQDKSRRRFVLSFTLLAGLGAVAARFSNGIRFGKKTVVSKDFLNQHLGQLGGKK